MPNPINIISTLLPSFAVDNVAIFDESYNQLFRQAKSIKAVIKENSKLMEHPIETGAIITDHRIVLPVEIDLSLILASADYADVYKSIKQYFLNATKLVIQTRSGIYTNQIIEALPHEEDPNMYNALTIALSLKQVLYVSPKYSAAPKYPANKSTQDRGTQQTTPASSKDTESAAIGIASSAKNGLNSLGKSIGL